MWKRCLALTLTLAIFLLAAPAYALDPSTTLETAPTISPNSTNKFVTPNEITRYYKLELPHAGVIVLTFLVYNTDLCPGFSIELRARGTDKVMASGRTNPHVIDSSPDGTPVPLFTAEVPAGSYYLKMNTAWLGNGRNVALDSDFSCPHSNYSYTTETVDPTCSTLGRVSKVCGNCGRTYDTETIDHLPHTLAKDGWTVTREPTCTATGSETQTCSVCKQLQTHTLSSLGHDYNDWAVTTPATCAAPGEKARTCARCQKTQTQVLSQLSHTYGTWITISSPTCTTSGKLMRVCAKCGNEETQFLSPTGHSYGDWAVTTPPTCTAQGVEAKTCPLCGAAQTRAVDKVPHEYGDWVVTTPPTCLVFGEETRTCLHCPDAKTRDLARADHTYGEWTVVEPSTCSRQGKATRACTLCAMGDSKQLDFAPHQYTCWTLKTPPAAPLYGRLTADCDYNCGRRATRSIASTQEDYLAPMGSRNQCWWSCTSEGRAKAWVLPEGYTLLAACYNDRGSFLGVKQVLLDEYIYLTGSLDKTRLFLLDENLAPLDVSQLITDHPIPTT